MTRPLTLVQPSPNIPMHPETRASAALHTVIDDAWKAGHGSGEWAGYMKGWRCGLLAGWCWGVLLTAIGVAVAIHTGWM
jgi:hypothetical protein